MNGFGAGPHRGRGPAKRYHQGDRGARSADFQGRGSAPNALPRGRTAERRPSDPRFKRTECPPELKPALKSALDFVAGLIRAFGLPARLSFAGVEPARDGLQLTIDVRSLRPLQRGQYQRGVEHHDDELAILIGKHGATLEALSAVTNAVMRNEDCQDVFFSIDIEGYRARRIATLRSIAQRCAERVAREGIALELEPMPPSERRIVHMALANHQNLSTESTGLGGSRRVVILPRRKAAASDEYGE